MVVLWVCIIGALSPLIAHSAYVDPYLDPDIYKRHYHDDNSELYQAEEGELSDDLAIQVKGGTREAIQLAHKYGLHYLDQVFESPAVFHLHKPRPINAADRPRRDVDGEVGLIKALSQEPQVEWVNQQIAFPRVTRRASGYQHYIHKDAKHAQTHHRIPIDVSNSKHSLRKVLSRYAKVDRPLNSTIKQGSIESIINYMKEKSAGSTKRHGHNSQNVNRNQKTSNHDSTHDGLVRIPLSRNIGYGVDRAKAQMHSPLQESDGNLQLKGRTYISRHRQLKNDIAMLYEDTGEDSENAESTATDLRNNYANKDFNRWMDDLFQTAIDFNDPLYKDQWYLHNTGQLGHPGFDLNVTWAWLKGYTGQGIVVSVLDDGIQTTNKDISNNYIPSISYSLVRDGSDRNDPSPRLDPKLTNAHGTYCAAIIAGVENNSFCGVGVAYNARVGGVRIVDGKVTDIQEATALSRHIDQVDVFSASWGPTDDGTKVEGPGKLTKLAFLEGVTKGRNGKGVVYVWACGNGGIANDNCNLDGYTSSIYTLSVSALTDAGTSTFYVEPCASTLAGVYIGGEHTLEDARERMEKHIKELRVIVPELDGHCSETFQGTSAAAPLMAGVVALVLQANPELTWRDVQHIIVETSSPTPEALMEPGWHTNGKGKRFHLMQGFGAVNAGKMVATAINWSNAKPQRVLIMPMFKGYGDFKPFQWLNISHVLDMSAVPTPEAMTVVEHVVANITVSHPQRKLLTTFIVSPSGTTSQVLTHRSPDNSKAGFTNWGFMSVHFWGEDPRGTWTVALKDDSGMKGYLKKVETTIYGS